MNKKALMFLGGILGLIIITIGFIFFVRARVNNRNNPPIENTQQNNDYVPISGEPQIEVAKPVKVTDEQAVDPVLSYDAKTIWYFTSEGRLYKQNLSSGLKQEFLLPQKLEVDSVIWPKDGNNFIIKSGNVFYYYDYANKKYISYPDKVKAVDFLRDGKSVVYEFVSGTGKKLSTANGDLTNFQNILDLPDENMVIKSSPIGGKAFAYASNPYDGKLHYINFNDKSLITFPAASDNRAVWSPNGQHFVWVYMDKPENKNSRQLWLGDLIAKKNDPLGITSSIEKVAFDLNGQNLYFAVPGADGDSFWSMDLKNFTKKQIYQGGDGMDASNLMVSSDKLYFKNIDGFVYSLDLTQ